MLFYTSVPSAQQVPAQSYEGPAAISPSLGWLPISSWCSRIRACRRASRKKGARTETLEAPVHRVTAPEACARGPGAPGREQEPGRSTRAAEEPLGSRLGVSRGLSTKPTGWGLLAGSAPASPWSCLQIGLLRQSGPGLPRPRRRRTRRTWRPPSWARLRLLTLDPARPEKPRPYWPRLRRECPGSCRG